MAACNEHSRAEILRRGVAEAGRGLPSIEAGMPMPAGTGLTRRSLLLRSLGLAVAVYGGSALAPRAFDEGVLEARAAAPGRILLSVYLDGGADSLSLLFPGENNRYREFRPSLHLDPSSATPFAEDDRLFWHPSLAPLATLHGEGKVAVVSGVGYADPNQSHFTSRHFWEVGATETRLQTGWLGRHLDLAGSADNPLQGLSLDWRLQPALATARMPVASVDAPDAYEFWTQGVWGPIEQTMLEAIADLGRIPTGGDPGLEQAAAATQQSALLLGQLRPFKVKNDGAKGPAAFGGTVSYPTTDDPFPRRLAGLAAMIAAGLPLQIVSTTAPGHYDTHDGQAKDLGDSLALTAASLLAFQRDLEARGLADRVLIHVWTEFGRRARENASGGTDHGAAGTSFLIGSQVNGKQIGEYPGLDTLDHDGNLVANVDFRSVYASILDEWLGGDVEAVLPTFKGARPHILR
jgi:uncharacterized protein (DUF1501 family)